MTQLLAFKKKTKKKTSFFFCNIALTILSPSHFHMSFKISLPISAKSYLEFQGDHIEY